MTEHDAIQRIVKTQRLVRAGRCALVALSGIDASGKGYLAARLRAALERAGLRVAAINIDGWLNLPGVRFSSTGLARHFYDHAVRFDEMFEQWILPLRRARSRRIVMSFATETATRYRRRTLRFHDVDVILLEGIFLLKTELRCHYDLSIWIDCTFETALTRALKRNQERLAPKETSRAYRTIYFPAQRYHFRRDHPQEHATLKIANDPRLL